MNGVLGWGSLSVVRMGPGETGEPQRGRFCSQCMHAGDGGVFMWSTNFGLSLLVLYSLGFLSRDPLCL